ncbi:AAA family ATPase [Lysobacter enzymogenes]|uniref:AAA family ATPase n=1 Tax=Lysobacter enzymogenes TaxID=69 RepID=UPI00089BA719|nr:AAA family ATPase [Lysobacter enzymogenes]SDX21359.1 AAA domain-containing protein [Lysobacter enzymogenes]
MTGPIIRRFKINGLYGYKDVEINFHDNLLILIAGNGSGKTTVLNALHAFLRRRFYRLQSLDFLSIECEFCTLTEPVLLRKESIGGVKGDAHERLTRLAGESGISEEDLYDFIHNDYMLGRESQAVRSSNIFRQLYSATPMDYGDIYAALDSIVAGLSFNNTVELSAISDSVAAALGDADILYLPTYRRIENPLLSPRTRMRKGYATTSSRHVAASRKSVPLDAGGINFGLEDVELRLAQLSDDVERISNLEYRNASATIIDDALSGKIKFESASIAELPDLESLRRFLSRISRDSKLGVESHRVSSVSDVQNEKRISAIAALYVSGDISAEDQRLLRYFLSRLGGVIEKTKETEAMLQRFVDACNSYLSDSNEEKVFTYDQNLMRVAVINSWTRKSIPLSQLSSGEKQIVSILAKLYLYERQKLVLVDEPELSLSIDWQRRILPDMMRSGSVCQLLAITHSPFVFDNELDPYAGALEVTKVPQGLF